LLPATSHDIEQLVGIKEGKAGRISFIQISDRALNHHQRYWAGLVRLVADYWEPDDGLISKYDKKVMAGMVKWIASQGMETDAIENIISLYLDDRAKRIKDHLVIHDKAAKRLQNVHEWLKQEAGLYDVFMTPTGPIKKLQSINFNAMKTQEEFEIFYKKVFNVAWKYVFSKNHFSSEREAQEVAIKMSAMG